MKSKVNFYLYFLKYTTLGLESEVSAFINSIKRLRNVIDTTFH